MLSREDGLIDWGMTGMQLARRVRGFQPWPNAYTHFRGQKLVIWKARRLLANRGELPPGQVMQARGDSLYVLCGVGALEVSEVQLEGRKRVSARDFINGMHVQEGEIFG